MVKALNYAEGFIPMDLTVEDLVHVYKEIFGDEYVSLNETPSVFIKLHRSDDRFPMNEKVFVEPKTDFVEDTVSAEDVDNPIVTRVRFFGVKLKVAVEENQISSQKIMLVLKHLGGYYRHPGYSWIHVEPTGKTDFSYLLEKHSLRNMLSRREKLMKDLAEINNAIAEYVANREEA